ncbi:hypothetical protein B7494_g8202 [Chlorociboria aeruginascens]|nr:hypothetical protein B7494_g8202 [Chlorociboria aeruginascens]
MHPTTRLFQNCRITLFTRANCSLCTNAKQTLSNIWDTRPFVYKELNVMAPEERSWRNIYEFDVPVISHATPIGNTPSALQALLEDLNIEHHQEQAPKQFYGKFLHITDLHPDSHYKFHSSTAKDDACHRGEGTAGTYGAETSDCDTPFSLIDATFDWIEENIRDSIDFVVWTGDSARHDNDEEIPRNQDEVLRTNEWIAGKFEQLSGNRKGSNSIPIVPTFGNNDILPHNILLSGPNKWLKKYTDVWSKFIPEEQRHGFERGGWFFTEVIPNKLAVFSLNTLYFFKNNAAVDGCGLHSEPGYEHMEWLRVQLQFIRQRGMKAILTGHVPPARTDSKMLWDETCWQKYTLWLQQYRDVVVGGLYGHMNIDHFMLQDTKEVDLLVLEGQSSAHQLVRSTMDDELTMESASDYLEDLREGWSSLPNPDVAKRLFHEEGFGASSRALKKKKDKAFKKIGGPWGERFQVTHVSPSVVPNYFPTLRIIEYNITGLGDVLRTSGSRTFGNCDQELITKKKNKKHKKEPSDPDLIIPDPPSKLSPPGPAYSPQTLTLLGYTQYYANLTYINNVNYAKSFGNVDANKWHEGKHTGRHPKHEVPDPKQFQYEIEYDTFTDPVYKLKDMTVRSYLKLAHRIGKYKPEKGDKISEDFLDEADNINEDEEEDRDTSDDYYDIGGVNFAKHKNKHKKGKHKKKKQREKNKVWLQFIQRAFVGTMEEEDLRSFEES